MHNKLASAIGFLIALAFVGLICYGIWVISFHTIKTIKASDIKFLSGVIAIIIPMLTLIITKHIERKSEIIRDIRNKKIPVYEELIGLWFTIIAATKSGEIKEDPNPEWVKSFMEVTQKVIIWSSDEVLKTFSKMRKNLISNEPQSAIFLLEDLMLNIRKDLGHNNRNITRGDVLSLFINDVDENLLG